MLYYEYNNNLLLNQIKYKKFFFYNVNNFVIHIFLFYSFNYL